MKVNEFALSSRCIISAALLIFNSVSVGTVLGQEKASPPATDQRCTIDLRNAGHMADIVSNVLGTEHRPESEVRAFLAGAEKTYPNGEALMRAAAKRRMGSVVKS